MKSHRQVWLLIAVVSILAPALSWRFLGQPAAASEISPPRPLSEQAARPKPATGDMVAFKGSPAALPLKVQTEAIKRAVASGDFRQWRPALLELLNPLFE